MKSPSGYRSSAHARKTHTRAERRIDSAQAKKFTLGPYNTCALSALKRFDCLMARHRFVARVLAGYNSELEVGCRQGFTSLIAVRQFERLIAIGFFNEHIEAALTRQPNG